MTIDTSIKEELKQAYNSWAENRRAAKELNHNNSELLKGVASRMGVNKSEVGSAFRFAFKAEENGHDELDSIVDIFETMKED